MSDLPEPDVVTVDYEIAASSGHSGSYVAENILVDRPTDQSSRWSSAIAVTNGKQFIRLRLKQLCVLKSITFGKTALAHPCNIKEFKVLVGLHENNMTEILLAGLKNDPMPETFSIKHTNRVGMPFPTRYVEVIPLSAHGQSFNTSIWHISLAGITDEKYVDQIRSRYQEVCMRIHAIASAADCLSVSRERSSSPDTQTPPPTPVPLAHGSDPRRAGLQFEHPLITSLHEAFVLQGNWAEAEKIVRDCGNEGLLRSYRQACEAGMRWTRIRGMDPDGDVPCRRGGHAMCIDEENGMIYLFGGWDGQRSLDDFWVYEIAKDSWRLLSVATSREKNGPGPRACHKMVFDSKTGSIYLLGRLGDGDGSETHRATGHSSSEAPLRRLSLPIISSGTSPPESGPAVPLGSAWPTHCSEFYRYHTRGLDAGKWDLLSFDTASSGGPPLVSDHQMAIDCDAQVIYVSGGRVVDAEWDALKFSGLYSYNIRTSRWKMYNATDMYAAHPFIPPRWGHSMVIDPKSQYLFIFAGQRDERYLSDMYAFHIPTSTVTELFSNFTSAGGPDPCFTQRAVIDADKQEIYVLCGLTRSRPGATPVLESECPYWIYRYNRPELPGKWVKILPGNNGDPAVPQPRYAHQVVYDSKSETVYMHGGNAGLGIDEAESEPEARPASSEGAAEARISHEADAESRLDDFWQLKIVRPSNEEIVRRALYEIRQQQFREMCEDGPPIKALTFLQTRVSSVVNHDDPEEAQVFRSLLSAHLLAAPARPTPPTRAATPVSSGGGRSGSGSPESGRADSPPPRKRSRPTSPMPGGSGSGSVLRFEEDPIEAGGNPPSPERYRQRTQMFERLLAFVNDDAKQPDENLLDMLSTEGLVV
ncbi:Muskelin N-terminus-domain-containing protein [Cerioporus squamosus]|nr:Muskelin N-terminus-domain-containing protein [Cerioporus squamosus]